MKIRKIITPAIGIFSLLLGQLLNISSVSAQQNTSRDTLNARNGLPGFFAKLKKQQQLTIAYLGGSITAAPGYRQQVTKELSDRYPNCNIKGINAGVGGTGSHLGVYRMDADVLVYQPDLVFVEFAVNDSRVDSLAIIAQMEGIVRKIYRNNPSTEICFIYTVDQNGVEILSAGKYTPAASAMEVVAAHYGIPSLQLGFAVVDLMKKGKLIFRGKATEKYPGKIIFSTDGTHPLPEGGHTVYTKSILNAFGSMKALKGKSQLSTAKSLVPDNYENAKSYAPCGDDIKGAWTSVPKTDSLALKFAAKTSCILTADDSSGNLTIKFSGTELGFMDIIGPSSGELRVIIDNKAPVIVKRFDKYSTYYRVNSFWMPRLKAGTHTAVISVNASPIKKAEILKRPEDPALPVLSTVYRKQQPYLISLLVDGTVLK